MLVNEGAGSAGGGQKIFHFSQLLYVVSVAICLKLGFAFCVDVLNLGFGFIVENLYMKCVFMKIRERPFSLEVPFLL